MLLVLTLSLTDSLQKKASQKVKREEILTVCACYLQFALVLHFPLVLDEKCTRFQPIRRVMFLCIVLSRESSMSRVVIGQLFGLLDHKSVVLAISQ